MFFANADISWVDAVFGEQSRRFGKFAQQNMPVVMKIANDRHGITSLCNTLDHFRHSSSGGVVVDGDPYQFAARIGKLNNLIGCAFGIACVGVGHALHDYWMIAANPNPTDIDRHTFSALDLKHGFNLRQRTWVMCHSSRV